MQGFIGLLVLAMQGQVGCATVGEAGASWPLANGYALTPPRITPCPIRSRYTPANKPNPTTFEIQNRYQDPSSPLAPACCEPPAKRFKPSDKGPNGPWLEPGASPAMAASGYDSKDTLGAERHDAAGEGMDTSALPDLGSGALSAFTQPPSAQPPPTTTLSAPPHDPPTNQTRLPTVDRSTISLYSYIERYDSPEKGVFVMLEFVRREEEEALEVSVCIGRRWLEKIRTQPSKRACKFELKCLLEEDPNCAKVTNWIKATKPSRPCRLVIDVFFDIVSYGEISHDQHLRYLEEILRLTVKDASYARIDVNCSCKRKRHPQTPNVTAPLPKPTNGPQVIEITNAPEPFIALLFASLSWQPNAMVVLRRATLFDLDMLLSIPVHLQYFGLIWPLQSELQGKPIAGSLLCSVENLELMASSILNPSFQEKLCRLVQATKATLKVNLELYTAIVRPRLKRFPFSTLILHDMSILQFAKDEDLGDAPTPPSPSSRVEKLKQVIVAVTPHGKSGVKSRVEAIRRWIVEELPAAQEYFILNVGDKIATYFNAQTILLAQPPSRSPRGRVT